MNDPLVSVIITTFNRPILLNRAINSVLNQTYKNIEIIIIDDASEINIEPLIKENEKIKIFINDENKGGGYSRNVGIKKANGEFINFLDDDDILYPDKIRLQIEKFKNSTIQNLGMVTCHAQDERSGKIEIKYNNVRGDIYMNLLKKFTVHGIETVLYKRQCFDNSTEFDISLPGSQEYDLLIRVSENFSIDYVDEVLSKEFRSSEQVSLNFSKRKLAANLLLKKITPRLKKVGFMFYVYVFCKYQLIKIRYDIGNLLGEPIYRKLIR